jgi:hypothetical protein
VINATDKLDTLTRLDAESAIRQLHATYTHFLDSGDFAGVAELLQHAELDVLGHVVSTLEGLKAFYDAGLQVHEDGTPRTWHTVANVLIDVGASGETATSVSYYTVHQQLEGFALQPICTGKYVDQFVRNEGQWRFARRAVTLHSAGDLSHHVKGSNDPSVSSAA